MRITSAAPREGAVLSDIRPLMINVGVRYACRRARHEDTIAQTETVRLTQDTLSRASVTTASCGAPKRTSKGLHQTTTRRRPPLLPDGAPPAPTGGRGAANLAMVGQPERMLLQSSARMLSQSLAPAGSSWRRRRRASCGRLTQTIHVACQAQSRRGRA
eukprot:scaffold88144_cov30-Tisochrysis_lutea.AAC.1